MLGYTSRWRKGLLWLTVPFLVFYAVGMFNSTPCADDFKDVFDREKRFICLSTPGRIGNLMFAFASVYGIASSAKKTVIVQKDNSLIKHFQVKAQTVDDLCICENTRKVKDDKDCAFKNDLLYLDEHTNYRTSSYLQSWRYFEHVVDDIRKQFRFTNDTYEKSIRLLKEKQQLFWKHRVKPKGKPKGIHGNMRSSRLVTIGVHVRRGDITENSLFVKHGYMVAPSQYFTRAMAYFRHKHQTTLFLVCSDDMKWCKKNIIGSDVMYVEGNDYDVDLAVLSLCNHSIISVGTFGWWGAFLAAGETIYYKYPARNGSELRVHFSGDFSDYFYPNWIGMD